MANRGWRCVRVSFLGAHRIVVNTPPSPVRLARPLVRPGAAPARAFCHLIVTVSVAISPVNGGL